MDFICETCEKQFKLKRTLQAHQMIHTGEKPYECGQCSQKFRQSSILQKHQRTHSGLKPYKCEECDQSFSQISNLKRHQRKHSNEKPYKCEQCGKTFITSQNYQQHNAKHQEERKLYKCESGCGKTLKKHEKEIHRKQTTQIVNSDSLSNQIKSLTEFFTSSHPQIIHDNHVDLLFNGRLYFYNEENGKIENHEFNDQIKQECDPVISNQLCKVEQSHQHGPNCGHPVVIHNGHIDYLVNEVLHFPHEGHCDNHGLLSRITVQ